MSEPAIPTPVREAIEALLKAAEPYRPDNVDFARLGRSGMRRACDLEAAVLLVLARLNPDPEGRIWGMIGGGNYSERGWYDGGHSPTTGEPIVVEARRGMQHSMFDVTFRPDDPEAADAALQKRIAELKAEGKPAR